MNKKIKFLVLISIIVISLIMHFRHFSKELISYHAWRQTYTQTTIDNFYSEDFNIFHPKINNRGNTDGIFRMEFPLMQWLIAALYKIFGNQLIITRIFMFITGIFSVLGIYVMVKEIFKNDISALIAAWAFNFSPSFYYYTINPHPDNFALCITIWAVAFFFIWIRKKTIIPFVLSSIFFCIGTLSKLPFVVFYAIPFLFFINQIIRKEASIKSIIFNAGLQFLFFLLILAWYIPAIPNWKGNGIVQGISDNQKTSSEILDYFQHNLFSTLPELLLNYGSLLFFIAAFIFIIKNKAYKNKFFNLFALTGIACIAYFIFEINMIARVHDYYLFPFLPLLFLLVAYGGYHIFNSKFKVFKYLSVFLLIILPLTAYLRMQTRWNPEKPGFNKDLLIYKEELRKAVPDSVLCIAGNDISGSIFFYYINKKGWSFDNDQLTTDSIKSMINKGAGYLYSDSKFINENPEVIDLTDSLILQKGSINIYKLK